MLLILLIVYSLFFAIFAWRNFRYAIGLLIITLPTYLIRVKIGNLPSTLLEFEFAVLFLVWLIKYFKTDLSAVIEFFKSKKLFFIFFSLFFAASVGNIFVSGFGDSNYWHMTVEALGQWRAYFLEPMLLFVMLVGRLVILSATQRSDATPMSVNINESLKNSRNDYVDKNDLIVFLILSTISISLVAILQRFFSGLYAPQLWDDVVGGRSTAFFTTPNAIGLYSAPILFLAVYWLIKYGRQWMLSKDKKILRYFLIILFISVISLVSIIFSFSQGAWVALAAGVLIFAYLWGYKKMVIVTILIGLSAVFYFPVIRTPVLFGDQAGQNRLTLWRYTENYLTARPQNFIFGAGIRKFFDKVQKPFYNHKKMEMLLYPHNIILNFWSEIGLLGAISFLVMWVYLFVASWKYCRIDKILGASLAAVLVVFLVHGLVDVPYFKNDLAMMWWVLAVIVSRSTFVR